ncbi:recombinase family protein [Streptomyces sp. NPDC048386]|uniref:recombinase family protein n=1 Tax=Streptomyces sp. NPDC048386 TaxID=3365541 RepID=UPI00371D2FC1
MLRSVPGTQRIAREYRRLSDPNGGTSVARQGAMNATAARENSWDLGEPYEDDGLSASKYARKKRDDFERLMEDLASGETGRTSRFGADILMLWESSRGSRQVGEWVNFLELCEAKGVLIWVTTHERLYDPRNGRDRKTLLEDAIDSEYESYKTHIRIVGTTAFEASKGRPHGKAPDGLKPVYDTETGELATWVENPDRSEAPSELFRLLEEGHSLRTIEGMFLKAGYLNLEGKPFSREHLRHMATRYAYTGLRVHKGELYEGVWDGFIPRERFWNVQRIMTSPGRTTTRPGGAKHVLTAALNCGRCGGNRLGVQGLHRSVRKEAPVYRCENGCLQIKKAALDDFLIGTRDDPGVLLEYLARDDVYELLAAPDADDDVVREVKGRLAQERTELEEMERHKAKTLAEAQVLASSITGKREDVKALEMHLRDLTLPPVVAGLIQPGMNVWDSWKQAPIIAQRAIAKVVFSPRGMGTLYVHRAPRGGPSQQVLERLEFRNEKTQATMAVGSTDAADG